MNRQESTEESALNASALEAAAPAMRQLKPLTTVRFFAAFHVLLYHTAWTFCGPAILQLPSPARSFLNAGYTGVSFFFLLSGFILAYNYLNEDFRAQGTIRRFWISRIARIYPVYLFALFLASPKYILSLLDSGFHEHPAPHLATSLSVLTLTQAWGPDSALAWNAPGWSLSADAFFYLLFPILALAVGRLKTTRAATVCFTVCWILAILPAILHDLFAPAGQAWVNFIKFNPLVRLPEFIMGVCLGRIFLLQTKLASAATSRLASPAWLFATVILIGVALVFHGLVPKLIVHAGLLDPLFGLFLLSLAWSTFRGTAPSRLLSHHLLSRLGEAGYSLYILHIPIKGFVLAAAKFLPALILTGPRTSTLLFLTYITLSISAALATYKWLEVPTRRSIKAWLAPAQIRSVHAQSETKLSSGTQPNQPIQCNLSVDA